MNKSFRKIGQGIACLGLAYMVHGCFALAIHPYSDSAGPSELINSDMEVLEKTMDNRKSVLEGYGGYFSEGGADSLEQEIADMQVQLNRMAARKDSLRKHEDNIIWRRVSMPWTYITDRL